MCVYFLKLKHYPLFKFSLKISIYSYSLSDYIFQTRINRPELKHEFFKKMKTTAVFDPKLRGGGGVKIMFGSNHWSIPRIYISRLFNRDQPVRS